MSTASLADRDLAHLLHPLHSRAAQQKPLILVRGEGAVIYDQNGKAYLDALAGLWNVVLGHGRKELADAAAKQMNTLAYCTGYAGYSNPWAIELADRLAELCYPSINRFYFACGGGEANEAAFKTARYYWKMAGQPGKYKIISRMFAYHGTTLATMSATGLPPYWLMFEPRVEGFSHIASPYPYRFVVGRGSPDPDAGRRSPDPAQKEPPLTPPDYSGGENAPSATTPGQAAADLLEAEILRQGPDTVAAFIGEPVQGAGGVIVPPDDYWPRIRQICDKHKVLLIADEVITGFGRTGDWFALNRYGIQPDIVTFAKAITSGYFPMGGIGVSDTIGRAIDEGAGDKAWMHAYTYSAHPTGCAVALATLDILKREGLVQRAAELGKRLNEKLKTLSSHKNVGDVRGLGLMAAVELVADKATKAEFPPEAKIGPKVHAATIERGMFTRLRGDVYNLAPPFVTTEAQIDRMVEILGESISVTLGK